jgi:ribosomal protein L7/L12
MFESFTDLQIWLVLAGAAAVGFCGGRLSASASPKAHERYERLAQEAAAADFARLSPAAQAEVDRLAAQGKIFDAVKLIRAALNVGLCESKQIVDLRKRTSSQATG